MDPATLALVEMARQALDYGDGHPGNANKPHLVVSMSEEQLRDQTSLGYLPGGGTLPISVVRRLACDAKIIPLVLDSEGLPLDIGRKTRATPSWMRIALNERDKGCRAPGCDRPPAWCAAAGAPQCRHHARRTGLHRPMFPAAYAALVDGRCAT